MAMMPLQQTLKSLCSRTGWCYAVFWKLKRRSRMMLTWEDGYYESIGDGFVETGGNPLDQGGSSDMEGQIGLAVARMSYYVYSMGEGIIGRVAFTGKYQWVFHDGDSNSDSVSEANMNSQSASEKNPDGWQSQFAAGIKTIAVIAVPQGVVQLGSTKRMLEDLKWIDHIKSAFGALQAVPLALRSDLLSVDGQGSRATHSGTPPFLSGPTSSIGARRPGSMQQQGQTTTKHTEDTLGWRPYAIQASVIGTSNLNRLQSSGGTALVGLQHQPMVKMHVEPLASTHVPAEQGRLSLSMQAKVPHFYSQPSNADQKGPTSDDMRRYHCDDMEAMEKNGVAEQANESAWNVDVSTELGNVIKTETGRPPTNAGLGSDGAFFSSVACHQQKNNLQTSSLLSQSLPILNNPAWSSVYLNGDPSQVSSVANKSVGHEKFGNVYSATAYVSSHIPAKDSVPGTNIGNDNVAHIKTDVMEVKETSSGQPGVPTNNSVHPYVSHDKCFNDSGAASHSWPEGTTCKSRDPCLDNHCSQNGVRTLDDLEKFLMSFSKNRSSSWDSPFAIGDELSQALGPAFWRGSTEEVPCSSGDWKAVEACSHGVGDTGMKDEMFRRLGSSFVFDSINKGVCFPESKAESLLDAMVGNATNSVSSNTGASLSDRTVLSNLSNDVPMEPKSETCTSSLSGKHFQAVAPHHKGTYPVNLTSGATTLKSHQNYCVSSDTNTSMALHSSGDGGKPFKSDDWCSNSKKSDELSKSSKKRSRSGESTRPRPKDRQQIQDRVRELRDIVPNGSKCSIDALLEKTIKHMVFLHSVTVHADQLKSCGKVKEDSDSGASWALDLGSQDKRCPILVKDLKQPRQMLVEMMCEESGLFLEIADIIRSLGLTILRGVMESQNDKFWAKFVVEANRDVQRVEVLVSLIQRLHLDTNSSSSSMTMASQSALPRSSERAIDSSGSQTVYANK